MPKMPHAGEQHREAVLVAGGDGLGVAHRSARLGDGGNARFGGRVDVVAEREEGVGGEDANRGRGRRLS